ncbi:MAG: MlaD family protein [Pseudomonadota bacterium]
METRANHFVIGLFVLALCGAVAGFAHWMQNFGAGSNAKRYVVLFDGPVNGVTRGTPVNFNGVRVGRVVKLTIDAVDTTKVRVALDVTLATPVREDSRARIARQGLTGGATILISAGSRGTALRPASSARHLSRIPAEENAIGLLDAAPQVLGNADAAIGKVNEILLTNSGPIKRTIANIEALSGTLAANKNEITGAIRDVRNLARKFDRIEPLLVQAQGMVTRLDTAITDNEKRLARSLTHVETFTAGLAGKKDDLDEIVASVKRVTSGLEGAGAVVAEAGNVVKRVDGVVEKNEARVARAIGNIEAFTQSLAENKGEVKRVFADVRGLSAQLQSAARKLDMTLTRVSGFLEGKDGQSVLVDAREAVASFRRLSAQLEGSFGQNAETLTRSTKRSLAEVELFMRDGRRMVRNLDRVLAGIDRNPQRLLFGGSQVPEYTPQ